MADPRLNYRATSAPSFAGVSEAMARANDSFNRGMDSASGIISKYQEGIEEEADNALLSEMAGLKNENEFDAWIDGGALQNFRGSNALRDRVLGMRTTFINDDGTRARTSSTRAREGIALARESRDAAEYLDNMNQRDFLRENAGAVLSAQQQAGEIGLSVDGMITESGGGLNEREILARTLQAEAGNQGLQGMVDVGAVIANRGASGRWGNSLSDVILADGQFSAWNGVTGYAEGEQGQDMLNMQVSEDAYRAADAILSGQYEDRTGGATHYVNDSISQPPWLRQLNANGATRLGGHLFGNPDNTRRYDGRSWLNPQAQTGPAGQTVPGQTTRQESGLRFGQTQRPTELAATRQRFIESGMFTAGEIDRILADATAAGQAVNDERNEEFERQERENKQNQELSDVRELVEDPRFTSTEQIAQVVLSDPNLSETEKIERMELIDRLTGEGGAYEGQLTPRVGDTPESQADSTVVQMLENSIRRSEDADPALTAQRQSAEWADDPTAGLVAELGLETDPNNPGAILGLIGESGFDDNQLRNMIRDTVERNRDLGISEAEAAAAMARAFIRDPGGFDGVEGTGLFRNTLANRFPESRVDEFARQFFSEDSQRRGDEFSAANDRIEREANTLRSQIRSLESQLEKARRNGNTSLIRSFEEQIKEKRETLNKLRL